MSFSYNDILQIPNRALLQKRLTKAFFTKHFTLSVAEKKLLANDILQMEWLASIKPENANIKSVVNNEYAFEEIQLFVITLADNQLGKLGEKTAKFIQKFIPYQAVVIVEDGFEFIVNVCDKRINQADKSKRTIEQYITTEPISKLYKNQLTEGFHKALGFDLLDKADLQTTYKSYIQAVVQLEAAMLTGNFKTRTTARSNEDMALLASIDEKELEITQLRTQLKAESQVNGQVQLNMVIQGKKQEIQDIKIKLSKD